MLQSAGTADLRQRQSPRESQNILADFRGCGLGILERFAIKDDRGLYPYPAALRPGKIRDDGRDFLNGSFAAIFRAFWFPERLQGTRCFLRDSSAEHDPKASSRPDCAKS